MKTITLITLFVGALAFITNAYAVSANLGVSSEYYWRGASQGNGVSVSGGFDYEGDGFYAGVWTANLGASGGVETDYYIGTEVEGFDIGYIVYEYSQASGDFDEFYIGYSIAGFDLFYAQNADISSADYFSISYGLPSIVEGIDATLTYGDSGAAGVVNPELLDDDYMQLDLAYGDLTLSVIDTDADTFTAVSYGWSL